MKEHIFFFLHKKNLLQSLIVIFFLYSVVSFYSLSHCKSIKLIDSLAYLKWIEPLILWIPQAPLMLAFFLEQFTHECRKMYQTCVYFRIKFMCMIQTILQSKNKRYNLFSLNHLRRNGLISLLVDPYQTLSKKTLHLALLLAWYIQQQVRKGWLIFQLDSSFCCFLQLNDSVIFCLHQTGYSVVRSLSEAPRYASVIADILKWSHSKDIFTHGRSTGNISTQGAS